MAIYKTDLTQPLPVATPDYSAAGRAIETRTKASVAALSTIADIGSKVIVLIVKQILKVLLLIQEKLQNN